MDLGEWVTTDEMAAEVHRDRRTLQRWRQSGFLIPAIHFVRGQGLRSPMLWNKAAVITALAAETARTS